MVLATSEPFSGSQTFLDICDLLALFNLVFNIVDYSCFRWPLTHGLLYLVKNATHLCFIEGICHLLSNTELLLKRRKHLQTQIKRTEVKLVANPLLILSYISNATVVRSVSVRNYMYIILCFSLFQGFFFLST